MTKAKVIRMLLLSFVTILSFSACGDSNGAYPVFLGSPYQDVYDYCKENNVEPEDEDALGFYAANDGINANLDWFGDGQIYECSFNVHKTDDNGVDHFFVSYSAEDEDGYIDEDELKKVAEKTFENLKNIHGDPVGENPTDIKEFIDDNFSDISIDWNCDGYDVALDIDYEKTEYGVLEQPHSISVYYRQDLNDDN